MWYPKLYLLLSFKFKAVALIIWQIRSLFGDYTILSQTVIFIYSIKTVRSCKKNQVIKGLGQFFIGEQGWCSGKSPPTDVIYVWFQPSAIYGLSFLLVLLLIFLHSQKLTSPNSISTLIEDLHENQRRLIIKCSFHSIWCNFFVIYFLTIFLVPLINNYSPKARWILSLMRIIVLV